MTAGADLLLDLIRGALDASDAVHAFDDDQDKRPGVLVVELTGGRGEYRIDVTADPTPENPTEALIRQLRQETP
jgi:hypothetical protein